MSQPKITVIIPTRERCDVVGGAIKTAVMQDYDNLEILVSDNCSTDATEEVVRAADDPRIRYIRTPRRLSMTHNWEFALSQVDSGWVTIIGDDDGLMPASLQRVSTLIQSMNVDAIRSRVCSYSWPSLTGTRSGSLSVPLGSGEELRDSAQWLSKVLCGRAAYTDLPMLYNGGFVSLATLHRIKRETGSFYRSCIPDVYSAVAVSSVVPKYAYSSTPLAINGASRHSTGTSYFAPGNGSGQSPTALFHSEDNIPIHQDVPSTEDGRFPKSLQLMVFESYLQSHALRPAGQQHLYAQQLEVILATASAGDPAIAGWGKTFASAHGLDFGKIESRSRRRRQRLWFGLARRRIDDMARTFDLDPNAVPLDDIYEASIAAATVRQARHCRANKAGVVVKRIARKLR